MLAGKLWMSNKLTVLESTLTTNSSKVHACEISLAVSLFYCEAVTVAYEV